MDFDDVLKLLGDFGRYQKRQYAMVCLIVIPVAIHSLSHVFISAKTNHGCVVPELQNFNCTNSDSVEREACIKIKQNLARPKDDVNTIPNEAQCWMYTSEDITEALFTNNVSRELDITLCTNGWEYDTSQYKSTIIQEFDLVCEKAAKPSLSQSFFFVGTLVGSLVFGALADKFGRKPVLFLAVGLQCGSGILTSFVKSFAAYTALRFITAAANMLFSSLPLCTETVGVSKRTYAGLVIEFFFAFGLIIMAGLAYFIREWRTLQLVASVPGLLNFLYIPFFPESARWLISQKRYDEAKKITEKAATVNNVNLPTYFHFSEHTVPLDYFGRRRSLSATLLLGGVACLLTIFIPMGIGRLTVAMVGKFGVTAAFGIIFFYTAELYPTNIRSVAVGICSTSGRIGAILSPYILHLSRYWAPLAMLTFSVLAISSGVLVLLLPETANRKLPDTMDEVTQLKISVTKLSSAELGEKEAITQTTLIS
ncbi:organic cation transporter protein-like [Antedon mediterranea]|uniref:organic cation transporter protein-like n=1 Tax=Antedon mediterranea TaxID=105859 RepID=UPI003AF78312